MLHKCNINAAIVYRKFAMWCSSNLQVRIWLELEGQPLSSSAPISHSVTGFALSGHLVLGHSNF